MEAALRLWLAPLAAALAQHGGCTLGLRRWALRSLHCSEDTLRDHLFDTLAIIIAAVWILPLREESIVLLEDHEKRVQGQPLVQTQGDQRILADTITN